MLWFILQSSHVGLRTVTALSIAASVYNNDACLCLGAGEPNFDGLDSNPYRSAKQRQEWEVKALLEKIQPELISLDPGKLSQVDYATFEQKHQDKIKALVSNCVLCVK